MINDPENIIEISASYIVDRSNKKNGQNGLKEQHWWHHLEQELQEETGPQAALS